MLHTNHIIEGANRGRVACVFFLEVSVFQRKNVAKIFALQGANVAKMDMLIRICPSLHGRASRSNNKERWIDLHLTRPEGS